MSEMEQECPFCHLLCTGLHRLRSHILGAHSGAVAKLSPDDICDDTLRDLLSERAPDDDNHDESLSAGRSSRAATKDLARYLCGPGLPTCREERQYAHILAQLLWHDRDYRQGLLPEADCICDIFYEVSIMRDYWHCQRERFNRALTQFVIRELGGAIDVSSDHPGAHANFWSHGHPLARWMMNAKPDLAIVYQAKGKAEARTLAFIECKYQSREATYFDKASGYTKRQSAIQRCILDFLTSEDSGFSYGDQRITSGGMTAVKFMDSCKAAKLSRIRNTVQIGIGPLLRAFRLMGSGTTGANGSF